MTNEKPRGRRLLVWSGLIVIAFLGGAGWQFTQARAARAETQAARQELSLKESELITQRIEGVLAAATIAAQLGSYERSRQFASEFFTMVQTRSDSLTAETRSALAQLLESRDAVITSLSRGEAGVALELARLFVRYRRATGGDPGIIEVMPPEGSGNGAGA